MNECCRRTAKKIFDDIEEFPREAGLLGSNKVEKYMVIPYPTIKRVKDKWLKK